MDNDTGNDGELTHIVDGCFSRQCPSTNARTHMAAKRLIRGIKIKCGRDKRKKKKVMVKTHIFE